MEGPTILVMNHIFNRQMSYKTGVMTCRSTIDGVPLGEKLSTLSTEDFEQINDNNNDNLNATTKSFLRAISTTCKAMGHTEQAAKDARRRCFAMLDFFGLNSLFVSTTPDDECSFRVRLYCKPKYWVRFGGIFLNGKVRLFGNLTDTEYSINFFQHGLPSLKCSEEDCITDFVLRRDTRMKYPGSCSLEFQSVMQILTKCMLRWDTKTQSSRGKGILGTVVAFFGADEEQGRKTLHRHWQIWVTELNKTLRDCLFDRDATKRQDARKAFCQHIDNVISACYGPDLSITHRCIDVNKNEQFKVDIPRNLFREADPTVFRRARHKDLYDEVQGGIMYCPECKKTVSTIDIVNKALQRWKDCLIPGVRGQYNRPDTIIPLSKERLDMAAYTFAYHMNGGCALENDPFWGDKNVRETLLRYRFEEHSFSHNASCFKKDCECRFLFTFMSTDYTYIHEDKGDKDQNKTSWYFLDGSINTVYPFMVIPKRPMGCQFINAHNKTISDVFNINTNVQIGDASQVFYSTLYTSKSTQDEDSEKQIRIGRAVIKRIKRVMNDNQEGDPSFGEGLSRVLSGLNAATTRNVISATMAHLIPCNDGSRFVYSHTFSDLLVGQMEATLEGHDISVSIQSNKFENKIITWPDSLADDYIHRPIEHELDQICFYEMTRCYKKGFNSFRNIQGGVKKYKFKETHPGHKFSHLIQLRFPSIPRIALPEGKLCLLDELDLKCTNPPHHVVDKREMYAKIALLMFYPFRQLNDLKYDGSYWKLFHNELKKHINNEETVFWKKGFEILQNIQDRSTLEKHVKRARDPISINTINEKPNETNGTQTKSLIGSSNIGDILDMNKQLK